MRKRVGQTSERDADSGVLLNSRRWARGAAAAAVAAAAVEGERQAGAEGDRTERKHQNSGQQHAKHDTDPRRSAERHSTERDRDAESSFSSVSIPDRRLTKRNTCSKRDRKDGDKDAPVNALQGIKAPGSIVSKHHLRQARDDYSSSRSITTIRDIIKRAREVMVVQNYLSCAVILSVSSPWIAAFACQLLGWRSRRRRMRRSKLMIFHSFWRATETRNERAGVEGWEGKLGLLASACLQSPRIVRVRDRPLVARGVEPRRFARQPPLRETPPLEAPTSAPLPAPCSFLAIVWGGATGRVARGRSQRVFPSRGQRTRGAAE